MINKFKLFYGSVVAYGIDLKESLEGLKVEMDKDSFIISKLETRGIEAAFNAFLLKVGEFNDYIESNENSGMGSRVHKEFVEALTARRRDLLDTIIS